jgi:hypothetical protein
VRSLATAYLDDPDLRSTANSRGENYWDAYLAEIGEQLGLCAEPLPLAALADPAVLARYSALLVGEVPPDRTSDAMRATVRQWVEGGGILFGLGTTGWDALFGNRFQEAIPQPDGPFSLAAKFRLCEHALTADLGSPLQPDQPLLAFSPVRTLIPETSTALAVLSDGAAAGSAVITVRSLGRGLALYTGFRLAQTIWVLHKGRPLTKDRDGDGYLRASDLIVIDENSVRVQYADELLWLLQSTLGRNRQPMLHQLPPVGEHVPDLLCFWGGDDEAASNGLQLRASRFLHERGLPYHINVMAKHGTFGLSPEDCRAILANGHEISLHYNFRDGYTHPHLFTREDVLAQAAAFRQAYGIQPVSTVNHCGHWSGWHEPAEWLSETGGRADNSFIHHRSPPDNPVNRLGFSFGTAYPHYFYRDAAGGNARIDFLEEPHTGYEVGYTRDGTDFPRLREMLDHAARYHLTLNTFYHPVYLAEYPTCQQAIDEMLRYLRERNIYALHMGSDALWRWWDARHRSRISDVLVDRTEVSFSADCRADTGMVVKLPLGEATVERAMAGDVAAPYVTRHEFGQDWAFLAIPAGEHHVRLTARADQA